jgi:hypothetical protein
MARSLRSLIVLAAVWAVLGVQGFADPAPNTPNTPAPKKQRPKDAEAAPTPPPPEFENVRKAIEALTPEQRKRFQENVWRWVNLPPEEKKLLRDREEIRKKLMEQDVQTALQESGLQLEGEQREKFVLRYSEERKKIEEELRKETMEKRKPLVKDLIARLRSEFSGNPVTPAETTQSTGLAPAKQ